MPVTEAFRQAAPFAALLGDIQHGVQNREVRQAHIAALAGQDRLDAAVLLLGDLHTYEYSSFCDLVLTRPSQAYTQLLTQHQIRISMSRKGNPYDNARRESFFRTLKGEEVDRSEYRDLADAQARIGDFLERTYNQRRLHSALGYRPPAEFERQLRRGAGAVEVGA